MELLTVQSDNISTPAGSDSVRAHTSSDINQKIDRDTVRRIWHYATEAHENITRRIEELDREWDMEKAVETSSATASLLGLVLAASRSKKWLILPVASLGCLLHHALAGWSPAFQLFRRVGIRTRREIDAEKYALKILRGDFDSIKTVCEQTHLAIEALKISRS